MSDKPHFLILNGPNLNLLGRRQPEIYGHRTFESYYEELKAQFEDVRIAYYQTNHEGDIIDRLQYDGYSIDGIILNAGGYTHTSVAIADTIAAITSPVLELHISNIYQREEFRKISYIKPHAVHHIVGHGLDGYREALEWFIDHNKNG